MCLFIHNNIENINIKLCFGAMIFNFEISSTQVSALKFTMPLIYNIQLSSSSNKKSPSMAPAEQIYTWFLEDSGQKAINTFIQYNSFDTFRYFSQNLQTPYESTQHSLQFSKYFLDTLCIDLSYLIVFKIFFRHPMHRFGIAYSFLNMNICRHPIHRFSIAYSFLNMNIFRHPIHRFSIAYSFLNGLCCSLVKNFDEIFVL